LVSNKIDIAVFDEEMERMRDLINQLGSSGT